MFLLNRPFGPTSDSVMAIHLQTREPARPQVASEWDFGPPDRLTLVRMQMLSWQSQHTVAIIIAGKIGAAIAEAQGWTSTQSCILRGRD